MGDHPKPKRRRGCLVGCLLVVLALLLLTGLSGGAALGYIPIPANALTIGTTNSHTNGFQMTLGRSPGAAWGYRNPIGGRVHCTVLDCQGSKCDYNMLFAG